ncbi:Cell division cycle and apoptosis regulator protein 1 [Orchesella cincta]|uniref:Cell division cycle and apoptosis regulator protein 1 n=1 Tax=Orchesella cincta TaxID=48709 RepID=A0A1D2N6L7_ORCCI|nr:Cell division cycle and apoptosis regulator protein 1 [Orchesella cincta]
MQDSKTTDENVEVESANQKEIAGNQMGDSSNADVLNLQGDQVSNTTTAADDNVAIVEGQISVPTVNNVENIKLPTHFSLLSPKTMNVTQLREELNRRHISAKGLKAHLTSRLIKALKEEELLQAEQKQNTEETVKEEEVKNSNEANSAVCVNTMDVDGNQCDGETGQLPLDAVKNEQNSEDEHCIRLVNPSLLMEPQDDEISVEDGELKEEIVNGEVNSQVFREYEQMFSKFPQDMFPIIKPGMKEEDVKMWERRYALPKNPRLLAFPSTTAKSGNFDCLSMTLGLLRDYRIIDKKEDSFEVSLFSEFFYEMLQRDFAFRIYREIVSESKKSSADETPSIKENEKDEKTGKEGSESATKKRKLSTSSAIQNAQPTKTTDPYLLLSFIFFDVTRCGYITETDLEDLCNSIGIGLTRAQIRKYVQKVVHKGTLYYRKWTDRPEKSKSKSITDSDEVRTLALGNRAFFPIFVLPNDENNYSKSNATDVDETANAVLAVVDGRSVDVKKLLDQLEKCEKELSIAESGLNVMKNSLNESKSQVSDLKKSNESLKEELAKIKEGLKKSESTEKLTKENFEVFKRSTERFLERVKDLVKFPSSPTKEKEKEKSENTKESGKSKEKSNVEPKSSPSE